MVSPNPGGYSLNVADAGTVDLGVSLAKACHVAIYGVLFDFNKSTLQPSSDAALQPVATMLAADKTLKVEIRGHTDSPANDQGRHRVPVQRRGHSRHPVRRAILSGWRLTSVGRRHRVYII
jgi:hypothetical protein